MTLSPSSVEGRGARPPAGAPAPPEPIADAGRGAETVSAILRTPARRSGPAALVLSLLAVAVVAAVGGRWTDTAPGSWYDGLDKPWFTPPGWVFGAAWSTLYLLMAVAAWLVLRSHTAPAGRQMAAIALYATQLALNLAWTWIFFARQHPGWALVDLAALFLVVLATAVAFARIRRVAAALLVPYLGWLAFAAALNVAILAAN